MFFILKINTSETLTNFNKKNCDSEFLSPTFAVESLILNVNIMEKLIEKLKDFERKVKNVSNEEELQSIFKELAPAFLYGGYIQVRDDYKVYIRTVEFYFHSEKDSGIHDPIVYHRNGRDLETIPYFPIMTLHGHASGFDITFESETEKYRASALIRSYEVVDKNGSYLKWRKNDKTKKSMFMTSKEYGSNSQSTYLYTLLNGFSLENDNNIKWVDSPRERIKDISEKTRQNVFQSESEKEYIKIEGKKSERKWSFTREDQL